MEPFDGFHESEGHLNRLRGLRNDAEVRMCGDLTEITFFQDDHSLRKVANQATHLDVLPLADDDGLVAIAHECGERVMCLPHERAGGVDDLMAGVLPSAAMVIRSTVGGDGYLNGAGTV